MGRKSAKISLVLLALALVLPLIAAVLFAAEPVEAG